jgi:hypothetical protein
VAVAEQAVLIHSQTLMQLKVELESILLLQAPAVQTLQLL